MEKESCRDDYPLDWDSSQRKDAAGLLRSTGLPLDYLIQNDELRLDAKHRPTTVELAKQWSLNLPPERELLAVDPLVRRAVQGMTNQQTPPENTLRRFSRMPRC